MSHLIPAGPASRVTRLPARTSTLHISQSMRSCDANCLQRLSSSASLRPSTLNPPEPRVLPLHRRWSPDSVICAVRLIAFSRLRIPGPCMSHSSRLRPGAWLTRDYRGCSAVRARVILQPPLSPDRCCVVWRPSSGPRRPAPVSPSHASRSLIRPLCSASGGNIISLHVIPACDYVRE